MNTATTPARNPKLLYCDCGHALRKHFRNMTGGCTLVTCDCRKARPDAVAREAHRKAFGSK